MNRFEWKFLFLIKILHWNVSKVDDSWSSWKGKGYPSMMFDMNLRMVLPGRVPPTCCAPNRYDIDSIGYRINGAKIIEGIDTCCWKPDLLPATLSCTVRQFNHFPLSNMQTIFIHYLYFFLSILWHVKIVIWHILLNWLRWQNKIYTF